MCTVSDSADLAPNETLVIIPDIHNKHQIAEEIIDMEEPDMVVFLGDYFDGFGDTVEDAANTAKWLNKSLDHGNRIHLIGNHDLSYMTYNQNLKCSGYSADKHAAIKSQNVKWDKLRMFYWVDDWLCTHAGLTDKFYRQQKINESDSIQKIIECSKRDLENIHDPDYKHAFFQVGFSRGGNSPVGGTVWCHYDEFEDIPGVKQIFGHTRSDHIRHKKTENSEHYCIDTVLNHYAVYQAGVMKIKARYAA